MGIYFPDGKGGKHYVGEESSYSLPTASDTEKGGVIAGKNLYMTGDSLNAADPYVLPTASETVKGGVKIDTNGAHGLIVDGDTLKIPFYNRNRISLPGANLWLNGSPDYYGEAGSIHLEGQTGDGVAGKIWLSGNGTGKGGTIQLNGGGYNHNNGNGEAGLIEMIGGTNLNFGTPTYNTGGKGGTIKLNGGVNADAGLIEMIGGKNGKGGIINMSGGANGTGGTIKGDIYFEGTPTFLNGANGLALPSFPSSPSSPMEGLLMSQSDKDKLDSIAENAQVNVIESIKVNGTELPVSDKAVNIDLSGKVDKVSGKQLSTNDYTNAYKSKLDNLASITTAGENITISGGTIKAANTTYTAGENITITGGTISAANTTYSDATTTKSGLMRATDKVKLDSLASITTAGENITITNGTIKAATGGTTYTAGENITIISGVIKAKDTTYSHATTVQAGLMSATDKSKLDGLDASKYVMAVAGKGLSTEDYTTEEKNKLKAINVSGGNVVIDTSNLATKAELNEVTSQLSNVYRFKGSVARFSELPTNAEVGDVYNIITAGGSDMSGNAINAGDNVAKTADGWDVLAGILDTSNFATKDLATTVASGLMSASDKTKMDSLPTAIGTGLTMSNGTLKSSAMSDDKTLNIVGTESSPAGGTINAQAYSANNASGGVINLYGMCYGTGDGGHGGTINMYGAQSPYTAGHGGTINMHGGSGGNNGYGGTINIYGGTGQPTGANGGTININGGGGYGVYTVTGGRGGTINMNGGGFVGEGTPKKFTTGNGGTINMNGEIGGTISATGSTGGTVNLSGSTTGGTINLSPNGSIKGAVVFTGEVTFQSGANGYPTATSLKGGLMSAADKVKLDTIPKFNAGATVLSDPTAYSTFQYTSALAVKNVNDSSSGGVIDVGGGKAMSNGDGGTILLNGGNTGGKGGTLDISGGNSGGKIYMGGSKGGSIIGCEYADFSQHNSNIYFSNKSSVNGDFTFTGTPTFNNGFNSTISATTVYISSADFDTIMSNFATVSAS